MPKRDGYIPGVPCFVDVHTPDLDAAVKFYSQLFGWECKNAGGPEAPFFMAWIGGGHVAGLGPIPPGMPEVAVWNTYVRVDSADETAVKVTAAGGSVIAEPFDIPETGRMAVFADPQGAVLSVWEPKPYPGANVVNEHGALNFNGLATSDLSAAERFYDAVFGWQLSDFGGARFWTLEAYGEHLEQLNPGTRKRTAEYGMAGFENVVAAVDPLAPGDRPHWSVTFLVDDADAAASRTAELGGKVLSAPADAPWVRTTRLSDPQGAMFIANQLTPPEPPDAGA